MMKILKLESQGNAVKRWKLFLMGQELLSGRADKLFSRSAREATCEFQRRYGLKVDGIVGNVTYGQAMILGFDYVRDEKERSFSGPNWPPRPSFLPRISNRANQKIFGKFSYEPAPTGTVPVGIRITDRWEEKNIINVEIPQLKGISGAPADGKVRFHKKGAKQLSALWDAWEEAGLLDKILTWEGAFQPRLLKGSRKILSSHAFGTAFDINHSWNRLGVLPALAGHYGSVRELVPVANQFGFYWGGHYRNRYEGMHFELAVVAISENRNFGDRQQKVKGREAAKVLSLQGRG